MRSFIATLIGRKSPSSRVRGPFEGWAHSRNFHQYAQAHMQIRITSQLEVTKTPLQLYSAQCLLVKVHLGVLGCAWFVVRTATHAPGTHTVRKTFMTARALQASQFIPKRSLVPTTKSPSGVPPGRARAPRGGLICRCECKNRNPAGEIRNFDSEPATLVRPLTPLRIWRAPFADPQEGEHQMIPPLRLLGALLAIWRAGARRLDPQAAGTPNDRPSERQCGRGGCATATI